MVTLINAENSILGRLATEVAKKALLGENVIVVNAEKVIISGKKENIIKKELKKLEIRNVGNPLKGPFYIRRPDRYLRKTIRGMLPLEKSRGKEAFQRVMVYQGVPKKEILKNHQIKVDKEKLVTLVNKKISAGMTLGELCNFISGKNKNVGKNSA